VRRSVLDAVLPELIEDAKVRRILEVAQTLTDSGAASDNLARALLESCDDPEITTLAAELCNAPMPPLAGEELRREIDAWARKRDRHLDSRLASEIREAERDGDLDRVADLQRRILERRRGT
jgi:hypothetical protein